MTQETLNKEVYCVLMSITHFFQVAKKLFCARQFNIFCIRNYSQNRDQKLLSQAMPAHVVVPNTVFDTVKKVYDEVGVRKSFILWGFPVDHVNLSLSSSLSLSLFLSSHITFIVSLSLYLSPRHFMGNDWQKK